MRPSTVFEMLEPIELSIIRLETKRLIDELERLYGEWDNPKFKNAIEHLSSNPKLMRGVAREMRIVPESLVWDLFGVEHPIRSYRVK